VWENWILVEEVGPVGQLTCHSRSRNTPVTRSGHNCVESSATLVQGIFLEDNFMARSSRTVFTVGLVLLCGISSAMANSLQNLKPVGNTFNGINFSSNILVLRSVTRGGSGAFAPDPTQTSIIFINGVTGSPSCCNWSSASLGLSGTPKSVTFTGPANGLGIADTLNQATSTVPEPSPVYLLGTGLMALTFGGIRRFRKTS
jgi:hypothetical protein